MQYILSKDKSRPQCDDKHNVLMETSQLVGQTIHLDRHFTMPPILPGHWNVQELYQYCYDRGYLLHKAYPHFSYSEHNSDPHDYQGF